MRKPRPRFLFLPVRWLTPSAAAAALGLGLGFSRAPGGAALAAPAPAVPASLTAEQMRAAARTDTVTVPTPAELFTALGKQCRPDWSAQFRAQTSTAFTDRAQIALYLGSLIADGFVAVEAQDAKQVKNLGKDILRLASALGASKEILERANTITAFADSNDWTALKEELEATQNEVKLAMEERRDEDLITLVSIGGWVRGTQVVSGVVDKNFSPQTAVLLRQPALVAYLRAKLDALSPRERDKPLVQSVRAQLAGIEKLVSFPLGATASRDDVQKLHELASGLMKQIATRPS